MQISYHSAITKIQKLQNFKKKKKKNFCTGRYARYRPVLPEIGRYSRYEAGTAGIFSSTKQGGWVYRIAGRYGIFWPVRPVRYGIDIHVMDPWGSIFLPRFALSFYKSSKHNFYKKAAFLSLPNASLGWAFLKTPFLGSKSGTKRALNLEGVFAWNLEAELVFLY